MSLPPKGAAVVEKHLNIGTPSYILYPILPIPPYTPLSLLALTPIYSDITAMGARRVSRNTGLVISVALLTPIYSDLE